MATAQDIMETDILTAQQSERVSSVVYNMAVNDVGAALVVDKNRLVSIFTERDLLKRVIAEERTLKKYWSKRWLLILLSVSGLILR